MIWALHGNLGDCRDWDALRPNLPKLETVDLWAPPPLDFEKWAYQLNDLVSATDPDPVLLGYSLGGRLAMHCATGLDSVWKAAVFVSAHPGLTSEAERESRRKADHSWAEKLRTQGVEEFLEAWNQQPVFLADQASDRQTEVVSRNRTAIAQAFESWSLGNQTDQRPLLANADLPQLWVAGENDPKFCELAENAVSEIPHASLCILPNAGHRVVLEQPESLANEIRRFLATI
tara:strand:+ start:2812 stop:3507 length:696 start_codon:yes stop_codon:yes gene_type:complete